MIRVIANSLLALVLASGVASCTRERQPCLTLKSAILTFSCVHYKDTGTAVLDTALPHARLVAVTDSGNQVFFYNSAASVFTISLSPVADSCAWLLTPDSAGYEYDRLSFYYRRQLKFLSNACGYTYFFTLDSVHTTHQNIDSVLVLDPGVTNNVSTKNLKIYFHRAV